MSSRFPFDHLSAEIPVYRISFFLFNDSTLFGQNQKPEGIYFQHTHTFTEEFLFNQQDAELFTAGRDLQLCSGPLTNTNR